MSNHWGVLLLEQPPPGFKLVETISQSAGIPRQELIGVIRAGSCFLLPQSDPEKAARVAQGLTAAGVAAAAQPASVFNFDPGVVPVQDASFLEDRIVVREPKDGSEVNLTWGALKAVFAVHRKGAPAPIPEKEEGKESKKNWMMKDAEKKNKAPQSLAGDLVVLAGAGSAVSVLGAILVDYVVDMQTTEETGKGRPIWMRSQEAAAAFAKSEMAGREDDILLLVMGVDPAMVFMLEKGRFNYGYLGNRRTAGSAFNFSAVVEDFVRLARPFYSNQAFVEMSEKRGVGPKEIVDGITLKHWLRERMTMLRLIQNGEVPPETLAVIDGKRSILLYYGETSG